MIILPKSGYDVKYMNVNFGWLVQWSQHESNNKETKQIQLWTSILGTNKNCLEVTRFRNLKGHCFLNLKSHKNKFKGNFWSEVINPWHSAKIFPWIFSSGSFPCLPHPEIFRPQKTLFIIFNPSCRCKFSVAACRQPTPTKLLIQNTKAYHRFLLHHPKNNCFIVSR